MPLTEREAKVLHEILEWENQLNQYLPNDFELTFDKYLERSFSLLSEDVQSQFFRCWIAGFSSSCVDPRLPVTNGCKRAHPVNWTYFS